MVLFPEISHAGPALEAITLRKRIEFFRSSGGVFPIEPNSEALTPEHKLDIPDGGATSATDQEACLCPHAAVKLKFFAWASVALAIGPDGVALRTVLGTRNRLLNAKPNLDRRDELALEIIRYQDTLQLA